MNFCLGNLNLVCDLVIGLVSVDCNLVRFWELDRVDWELVIRVLGFGRTNKRVFTITCIGIRRVWFERFVAGYKFWRRHRTVWESLASIHAVDGWDRKGTRKRLLNIKSLIERG